MNLPDLAVDNLIVLGSFGANRAMEAEVRRTTPRVVPGFRVPKPARLDDQTLAFPFDPAFAWSCLRYLRTPSRLLWELYATTATRLEPLYDELVDAVAQDPRPIWPSHARISVYVRETHAFPAGPMQLRGTVKNALIDGARARGVTLELDPDAPDVVVTVRGTPPRIAIDLGGESLVPRGWRVDHGEAPLAENLAAQLLLLAEYDPRREVLLDPLAGSGTFPIEAAFVAAGAPRRARVARPVSPVFAGLDDAHAPLFPGPHRPILGLEPSTDVRHALQNLARAHVPTPVHVSSGDFRALDPAGLEAHLRRALPEADPDVSRGLIVANPPYGERIGRGDDLTVVYRDLAALLGRMGEGWRAAFIVANPDFEPAFGLEPVLRKPVSNGGLRGYFVVYAQAGARPWRNGRDARRDGFQPRGGDGYGPRETGRGGGYEDRRSEYGDRGGGYDRGAEPGGERRFGPGDGRGAPSGRGPRRR